MTTKNGETQLKYLQSQIQYYASHLSLADMKAAGIMAFSVAISGVTADKMVWDEAPALLLDRFTFHRVLPRWWRRCCREAPARQSAVLRISTSV
jgi:hypothetical protein